MMQRIASLLLALGLLVAPSAIAQHTSFHPVAPGATKVLPGWGPAPADASAVENVKRYTERIAYLVKHGFAGSASLTFIRMSPIPGFPEPPAVPYVVFRCAQNVEESIHDYSLFLKTPWTTLAELKNHCKFGNRAVLEPFEEAPAPPPLPPPSTLPPQPANPVGSEIVDGSGSFYSLPGDLHPAGFVFTAPDGRKYVKTVRATPFGKQSWYRLVE